MSSRTEASARGRSNQSFVMFPHDLLESPAWRDLKSDSIKLLLGMATGYKGHLTGPLVCSVRQAKKIVGCGINRPKTLFEELLSHGFLESHFQSCFAVKNRRASEWYLSWLPHKDTPPSNRWRKWEPLKKKRSPLACPTVTPSVNDKRKSTQLEVQSHGNRDRTVTDSVGNDHGGNDTSIIYHGSSSETGTPESSLGHSTSSPTFPRPFDSESELGQLVVSLLRDAPLQNSSRTRRQYDSIVRKCIDAGFPSKEVTNVVSERIANARRARKHSKSVSLALLDLPYRRSFPFPLAITPWPNGNSIEA
jgi:hypothetical protein